MSVMEDSRYNEIYNLKIQTISEKKARSRNMTKQSIKVLVTAMEKLNDIISSINNPSSAIT